MDDSGEMPTLTSPDELREYVDGSPKSLFRWLSRVRARAGEVLEQAVKNGTHGKDELRSIDELDRHLSINKAQQLQGMAIAKVKSEHLRAKHKGAFEVDDDPFSPDYGKVTNITNPDGSSPYLHDILEEAMVNEDAYDFTSAQLDMVTRA